MGCCWVSTERNCSESSTVRGQLRRSRAPRRRLCIQIAERAVAGSRWPSPPVCEREAVRGGDLPTAATRMCGASRGGSNGRKLSPVTAKNPQAAFQTLDSRTSVDVRWLRYASAAASKLILLVGDPPYPGRRQLGERRRLHRDSRGEMVCVLRGGRSGSSSTCLTGVAFRDGESVLTIA
jgi:hypothetical protein